MPRAAKLAGRARRLGSEMTERMLRGIGCFEKGTLIETNQGLKPIEDVKTGDYVLAKNEKTGALGFKKVTDTYIGHEKQIIELKFQEDGKVKEKIKSTPNHPFMVKGKGWVAASKRQPGDVVFTSSGGYLKLSSGTWLAEKATVYNITVEEYQTYFVGKAGVWVHNNDPCSHASKSGTKWGPAHTKKNPKHNNAIENELDWADSQGATNPLKNKGQVDVNGNPVRSTAGTRIRPENGTRNNTNYVSNHQLDNTAELNRELQNFKKMQSADPNAVNSLKVQY